MKNIKDYEIKLNVCAITKNENWLNVPGKGKISYSTQIHKCQYSFGCHREKYLI